MRLFDQEKKKSIADILLLLTSEEASELRDELERLLTESKENNHGHISDSSFTKEITISIYDANKIEGFSHRIKKLIIEDQ